MTPHLLLCLVPFIASAWARSQIGDSESISNYDIHAQFQEAEEAKVSTNSTEARITNGSPAKPGQFPWQAYILSTTFSDGKVLTANCGGSLISRKWIITAAHCVHSWPQNDVYLGANDITSLYSRTVQYFSVDRSNIFEHRDYNSNGRHCNDIALLQLPRFAVFNAYVQPIELTDGSRAYEQPGLPITLSGWGLTNNQQETSQLLYANQIITSPDECKSVFGNSYIASSQICVSGMGGNSVCKGDSGGPLVHYTYDGRPKLIGITSLLLKGAKCEDPVPKVFTRISYFNDFIYRITRTNP